MKVTIFPSSASGVIQAPASKSSMQRACAAALLHHGSTVIKNPGHSNDDIAALGVISAMGAQVDAAQPDSLIVRSNGIHPVADTVSCGESGLGIRMFTPLISLCDQTITITGEGSLRTRPMDFFDEVMPKLGVRITSQRGKLPLQIKGPVKPTDITIDGSLSSQFLTGLLFAYAAADASGISIHVKNLTSKPYIDLTLMVMRHFGWTVENRNYESFYFDQYVPNKKFGEQIEYTVEGDWSGGAFLLVAGAIAGGITVKGLDHKSPQADKAILHALTSAGAAVVVDDNVIHVSPGQLSAFRFDATQCPDLFPPLVALASYCKGESHFIGAGRLTHKESDRALTLQQEFAKMGILIRLEGNDMFVLGNSNLHGAAVHSRHDHRIAMACAVAALGAKGETSIAEAEAINKSYPDFFKDLRLLGTVIQETNDAASKMHQ